MENPLAIENRIKRIKNKVGKKKEEQDKINSDPITSTLIGMNDWVNICAEACACCWNRPIPDDYKGRAEYIGKRSKIGHTSVLEHSNFVIYSSIPSYFTDDLLIFLSWNKYLNYSILKSLDGSRWHLIIGGSLRGYSDIIRETSDLQNPILRSIINILYEYSNSCAFEDLCSLGLLQRNLFFNAEVPDKNDFKIISKYDYSDDKIKLVADDIAKLYSYLKLTDTEAANRFTTYDIVKFVSVSVLFKNMTRAATHQLVRHRNAITQESQRYVDYSNSCFSSPEEFKPDRYDSNHKYNISFAGGPNQLLTLKQIGEAECALYGMLSKESLAANCKLLKEDARAFLPGNVQCKKIYMTFTYKNLFKFLYLREDKAAQAEIREYALDIGKWFRENIPMGKELINLYSNTPRLLLGDPVVIDEISYDEEVLPDHLEEDDYVKAIGLDREENNEDGNRETTKENEV